MSETPRLQGEHVVLEPLAPAHFAGLVAVAQDPAIWTYMNDRIDGDRDIERWADAALAPRFQTWATVLRSTGEVVGSTRYIDLDLHNRSVEVGNTFLASHVQKTLVNPEAKLLQLQYAFEVLHLRRVVLKTHHANLQSQSAIRKLGAQYEGTFRKHMIMPDGSTRHTVWFSILDDEWPTVKAGLMKRLGRTWTMR